MAFVERRADPDHEGPAESVVLPVSVEPLDHELVGAVGQVRIGDRVVGHAVPLGVEAFEAVAHEGRVRRPVADRGHAQREGVFVRSELDPVEAGDAFVELQRVALRARGFVVECEVGQDDGEFAVVGLEPCGVEADESVGASGEYPSVVGFAEGCVVELVVEQSVVGGEEMIGILF